MQYCLTKSFLTSTNISTASSRSPRQTDPAAPASVIVSEAREHDTCSSSKPTLTTKISVVCCQRTTRYVPIYTYFDNTIYTHIYQKAHCTSSHPSETKHPGGRTARMETCILSFDDADHPHTHTPIALYSLTV